MARKKRRKSGAAPQAIRRAAIRIADAEGMVRSVSKSRWEVASGSSPGSWHMVAITDGGIACDCPYSTNRGGAPCKHSVAIEIILLREAETIQSGETTVLEEPGVCCTRCGSTNHRKDGIRTRKRREDGQRYRCLNEQCRARFTDGLGFTGRHLPPKAILMALMLFAMGVSPEGITLVLDQQMTLKVHRASVQRWADRYVRLVERYAGRLRPSTGGVWSCDEKFARIMGTDHWVFTVMDTASRFILSWDVSPRKLTYDAVSLFSRARDRTGCIPRIFKTDGLHPFRPAFRKAFWRRRGPRPFHFRESHIRNRRCTNNGHERFNGTLGEFLEGARGLQRTDSTLVRASLLHYNFIRPHRGLGGITPAAAAGINVRGTNTWLTLIQHAALAAI